MTDSRESYTHGHHDSVLRSHRWRTIANSAAYLEPHLAPGLSLLDLGCGPGTITREFAARLAGGRVVGVDASADIVAQASADAGDGMPSLEFLVGNAYELPFDDATFDISHAHQVLQHVADPVAVLREMRRVTRPGGLVAARDVDYGGVVIHPSLPGLERWERVYDSVHRANGGDPHAGRALKAWAHRAGFSEVVGSASVWGFGSAEERDWWGSSWAERSLKSNFATDALAQGAATQADLDEISAAWLQWAADDDAVFMFPHGEILARV